MLDDFRTLYQCLRDAHYTPEQKALMGSLGILGGLYVLHETRLLQVLAELGISRIRLLGLKKGSGVHFGPIFLKDSERVRHCHIVGSPGSGKTEATKLLIFEDIRRKRGCFIIDAKGDRELYDEVKAYCRKEGREKDLKLLSATFPDESCVWNPCGLGNPSELQSKFLNSNVYSEAFYAKACELSLLQAFNLLVSKRPEGFNVSHLVQELRELASSQRNQYTEGLFFDFGSLADSEWGPILGCQSEDQSEEKRELISLLDIVQNNQILFIHLPTEGKSIQSSRIGRLLTQELILISGLRKSFPALNHAGVFSVYIDEFDAFATESFATFLNKGRSSNFMIHIAHQTLSDLRKISPEFAGQILGNCNVHLIFRQDDPDDAELWSRFIGTRHSVKQTYQTQDGSRTGASSNREGQEFIIGPDRIKNLGVGRCIASIKTANIHREIKLPLAPRISVQEAPSSKVNFSGRIRKADSKVEAEKPKASQASKTNESEKWSFILNGQSEAKKGE